MEHIYNPFFYPNEVNMNILDLVKYIPEHMLERTRILGYDVLFFSDSKCCLVFLPGQMQLLNYLLANYKQTKTH